MDPLGLALENFNAIGMWREQEAGQAIDATGRLVTGETFDDVRELRKVIATKRKADFYRCLTQKLFVYALGRGREYFDEYTCDQIVNQLTETDGSFHTLVHGIVASPAFNQTNAGN